MGFYFRQAYKDALQSIKKSRKEWNELFDERDDIFKEYSKENESFVPPLSAAQFELHQKHVQQSMPVLTSSELNELTEEFKALKVSLPPTTKKKLAVFDLDETLIHWIPEKDVKSDTGSSNFSESDIILHIKSDWGVEEPLPINIRPYWRECFEQIKNSYQIVIFTASKQPYADTILNFLDPQGQLIEKRIYRDSWIVTKDKFYLKDLRIFEDQWDMKDVVLIDNAAHSFAFQRENGVPMLPFYEYKYDFEMVYLSRYLTHIAQFDDLRPQLRKTFWIEMLYHPIISNAIGGDIEYTFEELNDSEYEKFDFLSENGASSWLIPSEKKEKKNESNLRSICLNKPADYYSIDSGMPYHSNRQKELKLERTRSTRTNLCSSSVQWDSFDISGEIKLNRSVILEPPLKITNWALVNENFLDTDEKEEDEYEQKLIIPTTNKNNTLTGTLLNGENFNFTSYMNTRLSQKEKTFAKGPKIGCPEIKPSQIEGPLDNNWSFLAPETNSEISDLSMSTIILETLHKELP
jgi:Dullard-like phosphatase family protein